MSDLLRQLSHDELTRIHQASVRILDEHGVVIKDESVVNFFKSRGFKTDGYKIRFTEKQIFDALSTAPETFTIQARNPQNNITVGGAAPALSGTGGPTFIIDAGGLCREATLDDYRKFCRLIQTSKVPQIVPHEMIHPADLSPASGHLDMLYLDMAMCDKALSGDTQDVASTGDTIELLSIIFGGKEKLKNSNPASVNIINPLSPLAFAPDQAAALMMLAEHNQAVAVTNMILLGSTAPVDLASALALGNAELLAGIVLTQLVRPGAPVIYGSTSCPMEMKSGITALGKPETLLYIQATAALARFYKIPSRCGGSLTDSHLPDAQAAYESALTLKTAFDSGVGYMLHAFGMMSSYMAASLEKWVMDEEVARFLLAAREAQRLNTQAIDVDYIMEMGAGGNYLSSPKTFKSFRSLYQNDFMASQSQAAWREKGSLDALAKAHQAVESRLAAYAAPPIDQGLDDEIKGWIKRRKKDLE